MSFQVSYEPIMAIHCFISIFISLPPTQGLHLSEILKLGHCSTIKKYVNVDDRQLLIIEVRVNREIN